MNVVPKSSPGILSPPNATPTGRDRAIAKMQQAQENPVANPTNVSPEELSAIKPSSESKGLTGPNENQEAESPKEVTSEPVKSDSEPLSTQYAILARKEKALRAKVQAQEQAFKVKEEAILRREAEFKTKEAEYQNNYISKSKLSEDTITTLLDAGITYDQITQMALNQGNQQQDPQTKLAIQKLEARLQAQDEAQKQLVKSTQDEQQRQYQQAVSQIRSETRAIVNSDPNYETIKATNSVDDVVDLIEQTFKEDGVLLSVEEAANEVENYLTDQAIKLSQLKKIQQRLQPKSQPSAQKPVSQSQQPQGQIKTLTNAVGVSRSLTAKERAILAFKGQLK